MVRLGNPERRSTRARWELFMHEGSHHFILRAYRCAIADGDGVTDCDEPDFDARFPTGFVPCEQFGYDWGFVVGAQTPHFRVDYQTETTGVAFRSPAASRSSSTRTTRTPSATRWARSG